MVYKHRMQNGKIRHYSSKRAYEDSLKGMFANQYQRKDHSRKIRRAKTKSRKLNHRAGIKKISSNKKYCETCKRTGLPLKDGRCKQCRKEFKEFKSEIEKYQNQGRKTALNKLLFETGITLSDIEKLEQEYGFTFDNPDDLEINHIGNIGFEIDYPEASFLIFKEFQDAKDHAIETVREDLEMDPSNFSERFLQHHLYVTDTDARIIAGEEAEAERERWKEDTTEDLISQLKSQDIKYHNSQNNPENMSREKIIEEIIHNESNRIEKELNESPVQYFVHDNGYYTIEQLMGQDFIHINEEEAARDAVEADGVSHYLARYDGEELRLPNGYYAYRTN